MHLTLVCMCFCVSVFLRFLYQFELHEKYQAENETSARTRGMECLTERSARTRGMECWTKRSARTCESHNSGKNRCFVPVGVLGRRRRGPPPADGPAIPAKKAYQPRKGRDVVAVSTYRGMWLL